MPGPYARTRRLSLDTGEGSADIGLAKLARERHGRARKYASGEEFAVAAGRTRPGRRGSHHRAQRQAARATGSGAEKPPAARPGAAKGHSLDRPRFRIYRRGDCRAVRSPLMRVLLD